MRFVVLIILSIFACGCASIGPVSLQPVDAKIPELRFSYFKDGKWVPAFGHAGDHFKIGDPQRFKIQLHSSMNECQLSYNDGEKHFTHDCSGVSEYELDLGPYHQDSPTVLGISVASEKAGIQVGHFYPNLAKVRKELPLIFKCPSQSTHGTISTCTRPATFEFPLRIQVVNDTAGKMLVQHKCSNGKKNSEVRDISGSGFQEYSVSMEDPTYCVLVFALKQQNLKFSHTVHTRFYNPKYIPLANPTIVKDGDYYNVCAHGDYEFYKVNGKDYKDNLWTGKCKRIHGDLVEIQAWDEIGRTSFGRKSVGEGFDFMMIDLSKEPLKMNTNINISM